MTVRTLTLVCSLLLAACTGARVTSTDVSSDGARDTTSAAAAAPSSDPGPLRPSEGFVVAEVTLSEPESERLVAVPVLVADDADLRATGLMQRADLPADAGMVFVFDAPSTGAFWMKNTLLPLSIAFVGQDGTVQQLIDMQPCVADPCPRYAPDDPYLYAVEVNQGFFATRGITAGWDLDVEDALGGGA